MAIDLIKPGTRLLSAMVLALALTQAAVADVVSELPPSLVGQMSAVPELDVSGADPVLQKGTAETRKELADLLSDPKAERAAIGNAYGRLGAYYQVQSVVTGAELCYRNAVALDPEEVRWHYYLGTLLLENGQPEESLTYLDQAQKLDPDYLPTQLKLARAAFDLNRLEQAEKGFQAVDKTPGLEAMAHYYLGLIALQRRDYQEAANWFVMVLALDPNADRVRYPLAQALRATGEEARAREELARQGNRLPAVDDPLMAELTALNSGARPHFIKAMAAVKRQDYAAAVESFAAGLELEPHNTNARISYARALYLNGKADEAKKQLERSLKADPKSGLATFLLALLLDEAGDAKGAGKLYIRTLELEPDHSGAHFFLAERLFRDGDYTAAAGHFADALDSNPEIDVAVLLRMVSLSRSGSSDAETLERLNKLLETRPDDAALRYAAGRLLILSKDKQVRDPHRALDLAKALTQQMPAPPYLELLALAWAANGYFEQAHDTVKQLALFLPPWSDGSELKKLKQAIQAFEEGKIPGPPWPKDDPVLQPPPVQAGGPMREYPAALPY